MVHLEDVASSSGEHPGSNETLGGKSTVTDSAVSMTLTW